MNTNMQYEAQKKNGFAAAIINFIIPGVGYIYCGNIILGIVVLLISIALLIFTLGLAWFVIAPIVVIDGFLCADRHNKKLAASLAD